MGVVLDEKLSHSLQMVVCNMWLLFVVLQCIVAVPVDDIRASQHMFLCLHIAISMQVTQIWDLVQAWSWSSSSKKD